VSVECPIDDGGALYVVGVDGGVMVEQSVY
jgi:hypothetical protein